ncbi:TIR domain-containing protein [Actinomadura decatromicini]|uniref:TIR domain-containing protein n=1 Tax=Actinomadura decatromicini TaxID=2604572 RepID=A0A5D3FID8_9ACTN|nr:TIR domain-containing protein [Actinomadura decatromicini]TYK47774.1 TIR domain-containing protein [Actinomadura decatromicini]
MTPPGGQTRQERPTDFFISYSPADERWASWIAWQLEAAGHRTMMQAWDFVPGTNFIDFMDRGLSEAKAVVAVLSRNYLRSRYGRLEWMAALRADPDDPSRKLVTVRIEDCPIDGLLSTITYVDLVGIDDPDEARGLLMRRIGEALAGHARPQNGPGFPGAGRALPGSREPLRGRLEDAEGPGEGSPGRPEPTGERPARRAPVAAPAYPAADGADAPRGQLSVLHVSGPRFGRTLAEPGEPTTATELQDRIWSDVTRLADSGVPRPDLLVVSGNLTHSGSRKEFAEALSFLTSLRALLGLEAQRVVVVPGTHDVTRAACQAYFSSCEADDIEPQPPYWPKWRHYAGLFKEFYQGIDALIFDSAQPWTLFPIPDLRVVVAGLNSTLPQTHREADRYGRVGSAQAAWFNERLRHFEEEGWLRLAAVEHAPIPGEPRALRDPETVEMLLGGHVNLFFQGTESEYGTIPLLGNGVPSIPTLGPGRHQTVVLRRDGLERWIPEDAERRGPERLEREWPKARGTFPALRAETPPAAPSPELGPRADASVDPVPDPTGQLLDRLTEACETRFERATIRRIVPAPGEDGRSDPPHLLLTHMEDGFVRQYRIGAHVGRVTEADVDAFVRHVHADGTDHGSELVYLGPAPARSVRDDALRRGIRVRSLTEFQGLVDLSEYVTSQTGRLSAGGLYPTSLYVPQRYRELDRFRAETPSGEESRSATDVHEDVVGEMLRLLAADHGRFLLLLGDFGRGKTFALRELARRIPEELPHVIPILIELRALDKAHSVDGLVAAHLANHGEELIDLKAFHYMLRQGRIVLLFDGFDELVTRVTYDQAADHLDTLLQAAQDKAKIVVASRTQHFKSQAQVLTALGEKVGVLPHRRVLGLEEFSPLQVRSYLVNRYGDEERADARLSLLTGIEELLALTSNPRMLSFIADLPEDRLRAVAQARRAVSPADLYHEILWSWLAYEADRVAGAGGPSGLRADDMWRAVGTLALRLWESNEQFLRLAELADVADTLTGLAGGRMSPHQVTHAVGAGSLLVRTDEGLFGFIHTSVMEWLVARHIADEFADGGAPPALGRRALTQLTVDFLCDLADTRTCQDWAARVLADPDADDIERANAIRITTRLRTPAHTDLRGARLQGEDLSYRDLQEVDLTGADLTDAQLVGANLSRAVLRDASLAGARLDEARLTGADLRGADLSRARLARADLRDVTVDGSHWTRAALVDAALPARVAEAPELREAAIVPGRPIDIQVAPAAVGVPYGFHFQTSRLPQPLAYSPGGSVLAVGSEDGGVLMCDAITGTPLRTLQGHTDRAYAVAFDAPGNILASGSADGTVRLWDLATGHTSHTFTVHPEGVWPVVVGGRSPSGANLVAAGAADGTIRVWDIVSGELLHELSGHTAPVFTAVFDPAGSLMVTGDAGGTLRVWDLATGSLIRELTGHRGSVFRAVFHPDGSLLAAGDQAGVVRLWDIRTGEIRQELLGHTGRVYAIAYHKDGDVLVTGDTDGSIRIWEDGLHRRTLSGHGGGIYQAAFSPDGSRLATADSAGSVRLWDPETGRQRLELSGHRGAVWPFAFRPDGAQLATSSNDGTARLWDAETGQCRVVLRGHGRRVTGVTFSPDGGTLASSGNDGLVRLWDPRTGRMVRELRGVADNLTSAAFNTRHSQLATATNDGGVHLWQAGTGEFQRELNAETDHVWAQAFAPAGDVLATANDDDSVRLWYWTTGREIVNLADHKGRVRSIDFQPGGALVATGCDDGLVRLWHPRTGELVSVLRGHSDRVYRVAFSPSGETLASASNDGTVRLWNPTTGEALHTLTGHTGRLWTTAFHPSGELLASAGDDTVVRLWDPSSGRLLHTLTGGHTRRVWSAAFSPDGALLATAGDDGAIILWDVTDRAAPVRRATLLGLAEGWAAFAPDGRYKWEGNATAEFWYAVAMCRFEPGELDVYLREVHQLPMDAPF